MQEVLRKGGISILLRVLGAGLTFLLHVSISRLLGPAGMGVYLLVITVVTFAALVSRLGLDHTVTRLVAARAEASPGTSAGGVVNVAAAGVGLVSILCGALLWLTSGQLAATVFGEPPMAAGLRIGSAILVPLALMTVYSRAVQGRKQVAESMLADSVVVPAVALGLIWFLVPSLGVRGAILSWGAGTVLALVFVARVWSGRVELRERDNAARQGFADLVSQSLPLLGMAAMQQITLALPVLALGAWGSSADVGLYGAAQRTSALLGMVLIAANSIVAPKFAALYQSRDMDGLAHVARFSALYLLMIAVLPVLAMLAVPAWIMGLFGEEFVAAKNLLQILAVGQFLSLACGSVGFLLIMTGKSRSVLLAACVTVVANAALCFVLIPERGAAGAALAATISLVLGNLLRLLLVWRDLGIVPVPFLPNLRRASQA